MDPKQTLPPYDNDPVPPQSSVPTEQTDQTQLAPEASSPEVPSSPLSLKTTPVIGHVSKKSRKKMFLLVGLVLLVVILMAGFVFGYYLPNKPDNAYKTGLSRTGYALDKLVKGVTEKSSLESLKKSDITLGIDAKYNDIGYTGSFNTKFDASKVNAGLSFTSTDPTKHDQTFSAKLIGELPSGSQYPNAYLQLNGIKQLNIDALLPGASNYDGKWIAILSDYLKSLGNVPTAQQTSKKQLTSDDIAELSQAATSVARDYVFTTDPSRAIFEKKAFVGKEKVDGVSTFHYQVTLNNDHVTAFCKAAIDKVYATNAYKKIPWVDANNLDQNKTNDKKDCESANSDVNANSTYDLWVDAKYKLIYKFRVTDTKSQDTYTEIGQLYKGGSKFTFLTNYHSGQSDLDAKFTLDVDFDTSSTKGTLIVTGGKTDSKYSVKLTLDAKPYTGEINVDKPANTVPLDEVLKSFGIDPHKLFEATRSSSSN